MNNSSDENLIPKEDLDKHTIKKYTFKSFAEIAAEKPEEKKPPKEQHPEPIEESAPIERSIQLENDLIECLLKKTDELSGQLAKLQMQFEKSQEENQTLLQQTREDNYKIGFKEGEQKAKDELSASIDEEKNHLLQSLTTIDQKMQQSQTHLEALEKELSAIAVEIAKEVIVKEVEEKSQEVALALAKELLKNIMDATDICVKVNTLDYPFLSQNLKNLPKIKLEPSDAIAKGGVLITSSQGNIDGNLMARYKNLKESVLDNLKA
ncbi:Flagellar assembly protein H, FliH [Helicobacter sp. NHP19-012]|uniref:Flagellar assembly protein FliH n=1 Tax=Helicobacter gastrofelis TaxID=2849642 RepID=A0ABM7SES1_9HELI|nr:Flagellar assembly protein H, FliH [Helicobacter sp. NHP19-012]GMB96067.1 Flagellar assembly protein H, FliH [Helicobacter sp. NHP22-001]